MSGSESDSYLSADEDYVSSKSPKTASPAHSRVSHAKEKNLKEIHESVEVATDGLPRKQQSQSDRRDASPVESNRSDDNKKQQQKGPNNDGDGWDDFEEWEDFGDTEGDNNKLPSKESAPVKADSTESPKQRPFPVKHDLAHNISSSYDTFPVLNELHIDKNKANMPINPTMDQSPKLEENIVSEKSVAASWGWKPWGGVVSFLSNATESVSTLTSQVSEGLCSVLENSIGVPDPEEMARLRAEEEKKNKEAGNGGENEEAEDKEKILAKKDSKDDLFRSSMGNILTGVTQIGNKVITGGLDTLEGIGKKTMTILQENDPLLLNKRKFLGLDSDKPVLSQILREAKEKSEETEKNLKQIQKKAYKKQLHFEMLFDQYHGLVHLEALEMLSKQSSLKLQTLLEPLTGKALAEMQETLNEVKELCDLGDLENDDNDGLGDVEELKKKLNVATEDLGLQVDFTELIKCWETHSTVLNESEKMEPQDIYNKALQCLAETTALIVNKMHKSAELLLIKDHHSTANEADSLVQLTTVFCWHLHGIANLFGAKLNSYETTEETSSLITSIFLEESNSSSYVKSAFQLFIPILQIGAA